MIKRLTDELKERQTFSNGIMERANAANRDLSEEEKNLLTETTGRVVELRSQLEQVENIAKSVYEARSAATEVGSALETFRGRAPVSEVEYRDAGHYIWDAYHSHLGDRDANDRLEAFHRAAAHQKTSDNLGIVPNPVIDPLINFVDAQRPLINVLGARDMPGARWSRPRVTQHTAVAPQGAAGAAADEKSELVSQKMIIGELTGAARTYGGYVNVSRQNIDFTPGALQIIVNDLAEQYAVETEGAAADAIATTTTTAVGYGASPTQTTLATALWNAAGQAYAAVKGRGRLALVMGTGALGKFGPLFAPINPQNAQGSGFTPSNFAQGVVGQIGGITGVMSAGLSANSAYLLSTAAIEAYEQRVGQLQVVEPSVLGLQVAYAGYFTTMMIEDDAIIPLTAT
jgi:HK97 family phage major capsid protein